LDLQPKLLSAIESKKTTRLGSNQPIDIDIRLICATNESIEKLRNKKHFRQDLLYRINTIHIEIPPLRDRANDIPLLAHHFIQKFSQKYNKQNLTLSDSAMRELKRYE